MDFLISWASKHVKWLVTAAVLFTVAAIFFSTLDSVQKGGVDRETALNAQYLANQNELGTYISGFYETVSVADRKSEKLETILTEAVKGRYEGQTSAQPGRGQLFSAILEAYPDLTQLDVYDRVVDYISAGRASYKNKQDKLLDMLREYDRWRRRGYLHRMVVSLTGYPSDGLEARIGRKVVHGREARDQMYLIVLPSDAAEAYTEGELEPLDAGGKDKN